MNAVVVGGSGQIGSWVLRWLNERGHEATGTYTSVPLPGLIPFDAGDLVGAALWLRARRPSAVFYPAGFTWVDGCERHPQRARAANLQQPLNLARAAAELGARFVYFSSDYVFDGRNGPYTEADPPCPLNVYGRTKLEAECALSAELRETSLIIRTSWVFGPEHQGKNFAYQLMQCLRDGQPLLCPSDQASSPTYGPDVARAAVLLTEAGCTGIFHIAGPEIVNRVGFAKALAEGFGLDPALIIGKTTAELGKGTPRPLHSGLLTPRLNAFAPGVMHTLSSCLADFSQRLTDNEGWRNPLAG